VGAQNSYNGAAGEDPWGFTKSKRKDRSAGKNTRFNCRDTTRGGPFNNKPTVQWGERRRSGMILWKGTGTSVRVVEKAVALKKI